jgi:hypothetical protein
MATILVSKTGMVLNQPGIKKNTSSNGEIGETHGVMRHLVDVGHRVVYFGYIKGELPKGVEFVQADAEDVGYGSSLASQKKMIARNAKRVAAVNADVFLDMIGPTSSFMAKADGRTPLQMTMKYVSPILGAIGTVGLDRIVVKTDIRCKPCESQMNDTWPSLRPVAIMSQESSIKKQRIDGWKYMAHEVRCDADGWWIDAGWSRPPIKPNPDWDMTMLMHAHIQDGYTNPRRAAAFANLLGDRAELKALSRLKVRVVGLGWEHFLLKDGSSAPSVFPDIFLPPVPTSEIFTELANSKSCPMITPKEENWHFSAKMLMSAWCGCAPILYGRGAPFTYDPAGTILSLTSNLRASDPGDLVRVVEILKANPNIRHNYAKHVIKTARPKYKKLDCCIRDVVAGRANVNDDKWLKAYGGLRLLEKGSK